MRVKYFNNDIFIRKSIIILLILLPVLCFISCSPQQEEVVESGILDKTQWIEGEDMNVYFGEDGEDKEYRVEWDYIVPFNKYEQPGTYKVYDDKKTVSQYKSKYNRCQKNLKQIFEENSSDITDGTPIVIILDLKSEPSDDLAVTGKQTHFEYYGLYSQNKIILCEPDPHNYDEVRVLLRQEAE